MRANLTFDLSKYEEYLEFKRATSIKDVFEFFGEISEMFDHAHARELTPVDKSTYIGNAFSCLWHKYDFDSTLFIKEKE